MLKNGPTPSEEEFEIEELEDDDQDDEQIHQFYDNLQDIQIDLLVDKMIVLDPLLFASIQGKPPFLQYLISHSVQREQIIQFSKGLAGFLPTAENESDRSKGKTHNSIRDKFFLAQQHIVSSKGYSMKRFLKSHLMVFEYLNQNIEKLVPIQRDFVTFCHSQQADKSSTKPLRQSFACLEVCSKKRRLEKDALRASS